MAGMIANHALMHILSSPRPYLSWYQQGSKDPLSGTRWPGKGQANADGLSQLLLDKNPAEVPSPSDIVLILMDHLAVYVAYVS